MRTREVVVGMVIGAVATMIGFILAWANDAATVVLRWRDLR